MSYEYFVCTFQFSHLSLVRLSRSRRPPKDNESKKTRKTEIFLVLEIGSMVCLRSECLGECQRVICLRCLFAEIVCWEFLICSRDKIGRCGRCVRPEFLRRKIIPKNFSRRHQVSDKKNDKQRLVCDLKFYGKVIQTSHLAISPPEVGYDLSSELDHFHSK